MPRITPPLRSEPLVDELGRFTLRWAEYFEDSATEINEVSDDSSINITASLNGKIAILNNRIDELEGQINNNSKFAYILKRLDELEARR